MPVVVGRARDQDRRRRESDRSAPGLANFTAAMLDQGTATRTALADRRRHRAARRVARRVVVQGRVDRHRCSRSGRTLPRRSICWPTSRCIRASRRRRSIASARADSATWCRRGRIPDTIARRSPRRALYGSDASVRLHRARDRGVGEGHRRATTCRRSGSRTSCRTTRRSSSPGRSPRPTEGARREDVRRAGRRARPAGAGHGDDGDADAGALRDRRQAGCAADAGAAWPRSACARSTPDYASAQT